MDEFIPFEDRYRTLERLDKINQEMARAMIIIAHNEDMLDMAAAGATELLDDIKEVNLNFGLTDQVGEA